MDVRRFRSYLVKRWGWVVTIASFFMHFVCLGVYYCFSITFIALQKEFKTSSTATSWVGSIPIGLSTLSGVFVTPLIYRFNNRSIALVGVILCFISLMATSLITVFPVIYLTYSVLYGVGSACASLASIDLVLRYFPVNNCARATMFSMIGSSTGMLCLGPLTYTLIERFGWRNMLRIVGSLLLVIGVAAVTVYHPPRPPPSPSSMDEDETQKAMLSDHGASTSHRTSQKLATLDDDTKSPNGHTKTPDVVQLSQNGRLSDGQMKAGHNAEDGCPNNHGNCKTTLEESKPLTHDGKETTTVRSADDEDVALRTSYSALPDGVTVETGDETSTFKCWTKHRAIFYPDVWVLGCCIMGLGVMNSFFYINMGDFLLSVGFEKHVLPWVVITLGVSEMVGKLVLGLIADCLPFPKIFLYVIGCMTGIACMVCLLFVRSVILLMFLAVVIGFVVMTIADVLSYSICNQVFRKEDAVHTWTVVMVMQGVGFMLGAVFGWSIDKTGSYDEAIYTSMGMYVVCALLCIAVPFYQKLFARERMVMFDNQAACRRSVTMTATMRRDVEQSTITTTT